MKCFKKKGFWALYVAIVLAGAFVIVALGLQNQSPGIPEVSAQGYSGGMSPQNVAFATADYGGMSPQNIIFKQSSHSILQRGLFPSDAMLHPGSFMFPSNMFPGDVDGMRTIMTCSGCTQTMSTCDWNCGVTFSQCGTRGGQGSILESFGGTYTSGVCIGTEYPTSSTCGIVCGGGGINTLMTCSSSLFGGCGGGSGNTTYTTCGGSLCNIVSYTSNTCNVTCGYVIPTSSTCVCQPKFTGNNCSIGFPDTSAYCGLTMACSNTMASCTYQHYFTPSSTAAY